MTTEKEINTLAETIGTILNEDTMSQIVASERDIKDGNIRIISSVDDI